MISILERWFRLGKHSKTKTMSKHPNFYDNGGSFKRAAKTLRIDFCEACNMIRNGAKTRIALEHTCGLEVGAILDFEDGKNESGIPVFIGGGLYEKYKELRDRNTETKKWVQQTTGRHHIEPVKKPKPKPKPKY